MSRVIHHLQQGSPQWDQFRLQHHGASEAAAMLGLSPKVKRSELLRAKHTGLAREFSDWLRANVLDKGHEVEALARPHVEQIVGEELFPITCSDGNLSASCDGLTMAEDIAEEHKQYNAALFATVSAGQVPDEHMPQCQQVLMVTGAETLIFVVSDGTPERMAYVWVYPDPAWFQRLRDGWAQFDRDLADYVLEPLPEKVMAEPVEALPAVAVRMDGALVVQSNLPAFGAALRVFVDKVPKRPTTDQEFADTEAACKALKRAEEALDAAEANALASLSDVEAMRRMVADFRTLARDTRLASEKMVERRKLELKEQAVMKAREALDLHIGVVNAEIAPMRLQPITVDWAGAVKGKRSMTSMQDALDTALAGAKIAADTQGRNIRANLTAFNDLALADDFGFLFADLHQLVHKAADDFGAVVRSRIGAHREAEAAKEVKRKADEAARIAAAEQRAREQEAARIAAEQEAREREQARQTAAALEAANRARLATEEQAKAGAALALAAAQAAPAFDVQACRPVDRAMLATPAGAELVAKAAAALRDEPATLALGVICERLGFTVSANFLTDTLHIKPAGLSPRKTPLYSEGQFGLICRQIVSHCGAMAELYAGETA